MGEAKLRVDIVSDVVCPWCIIGYKQLEHALEQTGTEIDLHWHPFELNPNMPSEGQNIREHVAEKYGATAEQSAKTALEAVQRRLAMVSQLHEALYLSDAGAAVNLAETRFRRGEAEVVPVDSLAG